MPCLLKKNITMETVYISESSILLVILLRIMLSTYIECLKDRGGVGGGKARIERW